MNKLIVLIAVILFSCSAQKKEEVSEKTSQPQATENKPDSDLPPGAVVIDTDVQGMKKVEVRDAAGNLQSMGFLYEGKRSGSWIDYHPNRKVKALMPYVNGKKEGLYVELNESGQFIKRCEYHNDLRHGDYVEFNFSNTKEIRFYQNGKIEGTVKVYYDDGRIMEEGLYKNGLRDGVSKWYGPDGKMSLQYEYKAGELVKK